MGLIVQCEKCKECKGYDETYEIPYEHIQIVSWWRGREEKYICPKCKRKLEKILKNWLKSD